MGPERDRQEYEYRVEFQPSAQQHWREKQPFRDVNHEKERRSEKPVESIVELHDRYDSDESDRDLRANIGKEVQHR
jgi:hypothetical protein